MKKKQGGKRKGAGRRTNASKGIAAKIPRQVRLSEELWQKIDQQCEKEGKSRTAVFSHALETYLFSANYNEK